MKIIISLIQFIFNEASSIDTSFNLWKEFLIILLLSDLPHLSLNFFKCCILSSIYCKAIIINHFPFFPVFLLFFLLIQIKFSFLCLSWWWYRLSLYLNLKLNFEITYIYLMLCWIFLYNFVIYAIAP